MPKTFVRLVGLTAVGVLLQAVTAGVFVSQDGRDGWITVHGVIADVTWVLALVTAGYAYKRLRPSGDRRLWPASVLLFALTLAQTGIGHLITDKGMDGLIVVHVPLAMAIFGLVTWLSYNAVMARGMDERLNAWEGEHLVEGGFRVAGRVGFDLDAVDHATVDQ